MHWTARLAPFLVLLPLLAGSARACSRSDACFLWELVAYERVNDEVVRFRWRVTEACGNSLQRADFRFVPGVPILQPVDASVFFAGSGQAWTVDHVGGPHPGIAFTAVVAEAVVEEFWFECSASDLSPDTVLWNSAVAAGLGGEVDLLLASGPGEPPACEDAPPSTGTTRAAPAAWFASPNPWYGSVVLQAGPAADRSARATATILDLRGRVVRVLGPSTDRFDWDGRDGGGRAVAPGGYVAHITSGAAHWTVQLVRLP